MIRAKLNNTAIVHALIEGLESVGGATVDADAQPATEGLAVSLSSDTNGKVIPRGDTPRTTLPPLIDEWVSARINVVRASQSFYFKYYFGAWRDKETNLIHLDLTVVWSNSQLGNAIRTAQDNNQKALYHIDSGTTLILG